MDSAWFGRSSRFEDDEATEVTGQQARRGSDASALVRINYVVAGERFRPFCGH